jgi:peptidoglycan/xylan/chitin deacetylase (PgdA/CDA1 family)
MRALAHFRGHRLVLVYHRLGPSGPPDCEIVPSVPVDVFRAQLQTLGEVVDLVTLDEILAQGEPTRKAAGVGRRPALALTFDDDLPSHAEYALPVLRELGVRATFFLSGRALHGLGAYWFQRLEALLTAYGEQHTAALLGMASLRPADLVVACERSADLRRRVSDLAAALPPSEILEREAIAALAANGMTVGFHTVTHDILPALDESALDHVVSRGREDLAAAAGAPVRYFAYPHGKADTRSSAAVRRAGFDAAFTGIARPVRYRDDRHRLGRWEPGPLGADELLINMAVRLHRVGAQSTQDRWT